MPHEVPVLGYIFTEYDRNELSAQRCKPNIEHTRFFLAQIVYPVYFIYQQSGR